jgi:hypothetical protein
MRQGRKLMPRRHGWLRDYEYELDQGDRVLDDPNTPFCSDNNQCNQPSDGRAKLPTFVSSPAPQVPININININLSDLIDKLVAGKGRAESLIEEIVQSGKKRLTENK